MSQCRWKPQKAYTKFSHSCRLGKSRIRARASAAGPFRPEGFRKESFRKGPSRMGQENPWTYPTKDITVEFERKFVRRRRRQGLREEDYGIQTQPQQAYP